MAMTASKDGRLTAVGNNFRHGRVGRWKPIRNYEEVPYFRRRVAGRAAGDVLGALRSGCSCSAGRKSWIRPDRQCLRRSCRVWLLRRGGNSNEQDQNKRNVSASHGWVRRGWHRGSLSIATISPREQQAGFDESLRRKGAAAFRDAAAW